MPEIEKNRCHVVFYYVITVPIVLSEFKRDKGKGKRVELHSMELTTNVDGTVLT